MLYNLHFTFLFLCFQTAFEDTDSDDDTDHPVNESEQEAYGRPLFQGSTLTVGGAIVLIMCFVLRFNLSWLAVQGLLALLYTFMPNSNLPTTKYLFRKFFKVCTGVVEFHYVCPECSTYIGTNCNASCSVCHTETRSDTLSKNGNFFIVIPMKQQLRAMFENSNLSDLLAYRFNRQKKSEENVEDIYDGKLYKNIAPLSDVNNISVTWNSDGASVSKSSKMSIWPIHFVINELPFKIRRAHLVLAGLWFGPSKPVMSSFLRPFVDECRSLQQKGFSWCCKTTQIMKTTRVFNLVCSCDTIARSVLQNIKQFNGKFGCAWCLNPGQVVPKGNGFVRIYDAHEYPKRNQDNYIRDAEYAVRHNEIRNGVKGASPLLLIESFDIVQGFTVDLMHCVLLGVTKYMANLWFDSKHHVSPWYIGRQIAEVDQRLKRIQPPKNITRTPRSLTERSLWKASEWKNWLLFYSLICLQDILPIVYLRHFLLVVEGVDLLLLESISPDDLFRANMLLKAFVTDLPGLYALNHMTYNIHQLLHITESVENWGPLWGTSNFMFETGNHTLLKLVRGSQGVAQQISERFVIFRHLPLLEKQHLEEGHPSSDFLDSIKGFSLVKNAEKYGDFVTLTGAPKCQRLDLSVKRALEVETDNVVPDHLMFYSRAVVHGYVINAQTHTRTSKRVSYCVAFENGAYGLVDSFVILDGVCYCLTKTLRIRRKAFRTALASSRHIFIVRDVDTQTVALKASDIRRTCIFVDHPSFRYKYCCEQPNNMETD